MSTQDMLFAGWEYEVNCSCGKRLAVVVPVAPNDRDFDKTDEALHRILQFGGDHVLCPGLRIGGLGEKWVEMPPTKDGPK